MVVPIINASMTFYHLLSQLSTHQCMFADDNNMYTKNYDLFSILKINSL